MDKYEYQLKLDQINKLADKGDYEKASKIANSIDWHRVRSVNTLSKVADVYEKTQRYDKAREILSMAYDRAPVGRMIAYRLSELCINLGDYDKAIEYYKDFVRSAPKDPSKLLLKYQIFRGKGADLKDQIDILEEYRAQEYEERWALELAYLYEEAGEIEKCVNECDELILWFNDGQYVMKALELKRAHAQLTPAQQDKFELRSNKVKVVDEEEKNKAEASGQEQADLPNIQDPDLSDDGIKIEEDGQMAMDMGDYQPVDKQITGQMTIEEILAEWEKAKHRASAPEEEAAPEETDEESTVSEDASAEDDEDMILPEILMPDFGDVESEGEQEEESEDEEEPEDEEEEIEDEEDEIEEENPEEDMPLPEIFMPDFGDEETEDDVEESEDDEEETEDDEDEIEEENLEEDMPLPEIFMPDFGDEETEDEAEEDSEDEEDSEETEEESGDEEEPEDDEEETEDEEDEIEEENLEEDMPLPEIFMPDFGDEETEDEAEEDSEDDEETEDSEEDSEDEEDEIEEENPEEDMPLPEIELPELDLTDEGEDELEDNGEEDEEEPEEDDLPPIAMPEGLDIVEEDITYDEEDDDEDTESEEEEDDDDYVRGRNRYDDEDNEDTYDPEVQIVKSMSENSLALADAEDGQIDGMISNNNISRKRRMPETRNFGDEGVQLSEDYKKLFTFFAPVRGMSDQLMTALNNEAKCKRNGTSAIGNIMVMGVAGSGKTKLAVNLVKAIQKGRKQSGGKLAKISADTLNTKDVAAVIKKLNGGALIIESASEMSDDTAIRLEMALRGQTNELLVLFEDERKPLRRFMKLHPGLGAMCTTKIEIPIFNNDELVEFGRCYAQELDYSIDEVAVLALYNRIGNMQRDDYDVNITDVKDIIDAAIEKSEKGGVGKLFRSLTGKKYDDDDRIILTEKDFEE